MNRYEPEAMEPMTREQEEAALAEQAADDADAEEAYEAYLAGKYQEHLAATAGPRYDPEAGPWGHHI